MKKLIRELNMQRNFDWRRGKVYIANNCEHSKRRNKHCIEQSGGIRVTSNNHLMAMSRLAWQVANLGNRN